MGIHCPKINLDIVDRAIPCCCGFRFGWSAIIGIIPVIGDLLDVLIAYSIVQTCMKVGLPKSIVSPLSRKEF